MKRLWIIGLVVVLLAAAAYFWSATPGHTPAGQPPLAEISRGTLETIKLEFNRASNAHRIIVLLSPT